MALLTEGAVRARAQQQVRIKRKSVTASWNEAAGPEDRFNVFLSHSSAEEEELLLGVKALLEDDGLSVYVDRYSNPHLSPERVTRATAVLMRKRSRASASLVYAYSSHSTMSRWMPWELWLLRRHGSSNRRPSHGPFRAVRLPQGGVSRALPKHRRGS